LPRSKRHRALVALGEAPGPFSCAAPPGDFPDPVTAPFNTARQFRVIAKKSAVTASLAAASKFQIPCRNLPWRSNHAFLASMSLANRITISANDRPEQNPAER